MSKHQSPNRHPPDLLFELRLAQKSERWQVRTTLMGVPGELVGDGCGLRARNVDSAFIQTHLPLGFFTGTHDNRIVHATA